MCSKLAYSVQVLNERVTCMQGDNTAFSLPTGEHIVTLKNRKRIDLTSIKSIERFDQEEFFIRTSQGHLLVRGQQLRIIQLDVDKGLLALEGDIKLLQYDEEESPLSKSLLHKLFG